VSSFRTAGVLWLVAAVLGATLTLIFRGDSIWYAITLIASGVAIVLGVLLLRRPTSTSVSLSTLGGVAWVVIYALLVADQSDDIQAWTADALLAVFGALAAFIGYRAGQQLSGVNRS
jgi:hypothetical protein